MLLRPRHVGLAAAILAGTLLDHDPPPPLRAGPRVELEVSVLGPSISADDSRRTRVRARRDGAGRPVPGAAMWLEEDAEAPPRDPGRRLLVRGTTRAPQVPRNPGEFDGRAAVLQARPGGVEELDPPTGAFGDLVALRRRGLETLRSSLPPRSSGIAGALLFGDRSGLPADWRRKLADTGCAHLFALSGLHVVLVVGVFDALLRRRGRFGLLWRLVPLWSFVAISGAAPPVLRAAIAASLWLMTRRGQRLISIQGPLAWALVALLVGARVDSPASLCLSFAAVIGIATGATRGPRFSPRRSRIGIPFGGAPRRALWVGVCATAATAPFTAYFFGTVAPWSPIGTLLLAPFVLPWMALSAVSLAAASIAPDALASIGGIFERSASLAEATLRGLDQLPGTPIEVARPSRVVLAVFVGGIWCAWRGRDRWSLALLIGGLATFALDRAPAPTVCLLDVGHGQCLVRVDDGVADLVDAGGSLGARGLDRSLEALSVRRLRGVFVSHLDADHCRSLRALLDRRRPRTVVFSAAHREEWERATGDGEIARLREALTQRRVAVCFTARGREILGWRVLWPPPGRRFSSRNEGSLALARVEAGGTLLIPGDLEGYPLLEFAASAPAAAALVLPHHGNEDPALGALLDRVGPNLVLASRRGPLPPATLRALGARGIRSHSTSEAGALHRAPGGRIDTGPRPIGRNPIARLLFRQEALLADPRASNPPGWTLAVTPTRPSH